MNYKTILKIVIGLCCLAAGALFVIAEKTSGNTIVINSADVTNEAGELIEGSDEAAVGTADSEEASGATADSALASDGSLSASSDAEVQDKTGLCVHVCGCVVSPGVYYLPEGSRISDAIEMAGGFSDEADETALNLAEPVTDGQQIVVLSVSEARSVAASKAAAAAGIVNINTATVTELMTLPGIGEARAEAIVAYRELHGAFSQTEDIMKVSGIKEAAFEKIKDKINTG